MYFCAQAVGFTDAAQAEFDKIKAQPIAYADTNIDITFIPVFLGDLLDAKWRESNTKWRNKKNEKRDRFDLDICGSIIRDSSKSCVFFTCAAQLVTAYQEIGHQLFESNVRCEIKNSPVNKAIKNSLLSRRGREEFKHLNNEITIICDNFQFLGPKNGPTGLRVTRPGVINGLQTIKTLADSVAELSDEDYRHFRERCLILTRVHTQSSVADYRDLVKSTNNQNPMKPRNLRSNDAEQVLFERYFSEHLGWFYERKEGAWNAFKADHTRWSTINRRPQHFLNGRIIKKVDNEEIAQAWLSFIGFAEQAIDQKRFLFSADKGFYDLILLNQTAHHGAYYKHRISDLKIIENARSQSPSGEGMLAAYVIRKFATSVVRSRKDNREEAVKRLKIEGLNRADQEGKLARDTEYLKGLILRGMLLMFVEYFGYVMFFAFAGRVHEKMDRLIHNGSIAELVETGDFTKVKTRLYDGGYGKNDILIVIWELYNFCISQMTAGAWLREWQQAPNRSKFIYSEKTREPLFNQHAEANRVFKDKILIRKWTVAFNDAGGVEDYLRQVLD